MLEVRVLEPRYAAPVLMDRVAELEENRRVHGSLRGDMLFKHQFENAKAFLLALNEIDCNAKVACKLDHGEFSLDGYVEVVDPKNKRVIDEAVKLLEQIGSHAKMCNGSYFALGMTQKVKPKRI
jgi:hypothetical protein